MQTQPGNIPLSGGLILTPFWYFFLVQWYFLYFVFYFFCCIEYSQLKPFDRFKVHETIPVFFKNGKPFSFGFTELSNITEIVSPLKLSPLFLST